MQDKEASPLLLDPGCCSAPCSVEDPGCLGPWQGAVTCSQATSHLVETNSPRGPDPVGGTSQMLSLCGWRHKVALDLRDSADSGIFSPSGTAGRHDLPGGRHCQEPWTVARVGASHRTLEGGSANSPHALVPPLTQSLNCQSVEDSRTQAWSLLSHHTE